MEIQSLFARHRTFSEEKKLSIIYKNLKPEYKYYVRKDDLKNIQDLIKLTENFEKIQSEENSNNYKRNVRSGENFNNTTVGLPRNNYNQRQIKCYNCHRPGVLSRDCDCRRRHNQYNRNQTPTQQTSNENNNDQFNTTRQYNQRHNTQTNNRTENSDDKDINAFNVNVCPVFEENVCQNSTLIYDSIVIQGVTFNAVIDTGSTRSFINEDMVKLCKNCNFKIKKCNNLIRMANGEVIEISEEFVIPLKYKEQENLEIFWYLPGTKFSILLGLDFLSKRKILIDPVLKKVINLNDTVINNSNTINDIEQCKKNKIRRVLNEELSIFDNIKGPCPLIKSSPNVCFTEEIEKDWYSKKFTEVQENPDNYPDFKILNEKLYKLSFKRTYLTEPNQWKLCIPENLKVQVLKENHVNPTTEHMGIAKTISRMTKRYYWPGLFRNISEYVRNCRTCQKYKSSQQQTATMVTFSPTNRPSDPVTTNLVGPLSKCFRDNNCVNFISSILPHPEIKPKLKISIMLNSLKPPDYPTNKRFRLRIQGYGWITIKPSKKINS